jgi:hypothetical protein
MNEYSPFVSTSHPSPYQNFLHADLNGPHHSYCISFHVQPWSHDIKIGHCNCCHLNPNLFIGYTIRSQQIHSFIVLFILRSVIYYAYILFFCFLFYHSRDSAPRLLKLFVTCFLPFKFPSDYNVRPWGGELEGSCITLVVTEQFAVARNEGWRRDCSSFKLKISPRGINSKRKQRLLRFLSRKRE